MNPLPPTAELLGTIFRDEHETYFLLDDAGMPSASIPPFRNYGTPLLYWRNILQLLATDPIPLDVLAKRGVKNALAAVLQQASKRRPGNAMLHDRFVQADATFATGTAPALPPSSMPKILVLGATPNNVNPLRVNRELKVIRAAAARPDAKNKFEVVDDLTTDPNTLQRTLEEFRPTILHFACHGQEQGQPEAIILGNADDNAIALPAALLAQMIAFVNKTGPAIQAIVLNACASKAVAKAMEGLVDVAVFTEGKIADAAAIAFSEGFYEGLTNGESVGLALDRGRLRMSVVENNTLGTLSIPRDVVVCNPLDKSPLESKPTFGVFDPKNINVFTRNGAELNAIYLPMRK